MIPLICEPYGRSHFFSLANICLLWTNSINGLNYFFAPFAIVKSKYGGLDVQQLSKMKELEKELSQYKKIVAELTLENVVMKDVISKKF